MCCAYRTTKSVAWSLAFVMGPTASLRWRAQWGMFGIVFTFLLVVVTASQRVLVSSSVVATSTQAHGMYDEVEVAQNLEIWTHTPERSAVPSSVYPELPYGNNLKVRYIYFVAQQQYMQWKWCISCGSCIENNVTLSQDTSTLIKLKASDSHP